MTTGRSSDRPPSSSEQVSQQMKRILKYLLQRPRRQSLKRLTLKNPPQKHRRQNQKPLPKTRWQRLRRQNRKRLTKRRRQ